MKKHVNMVLITLMTFLTNACSNDDGTDQEPRNYLN